ncbi:MFS transporter [Streptomyces niveus]|uniref:MFS transporter n=1 Tax=Streptomyces niveus TaxID=193462 RepID=UPI003666CFEA
MSTAAFGHLAHLRRRPVRGLLTIAFLARTTAAVLPITLLLSLAQSYGYGRASAVTGGYTFALALLLPLRGRLLDHYGAQRALTVMGGCAMTLLTLVAFSVGQRWPWWSTLLLVTCASLSSPPLNAALRSSWRLLVTDARQLKAVHAADSILEEAGFVLAPLTAGAAVLALGAHRAYEATVVCYLAVIAAYLLAARRHRLGTQTPTNPPASDGRRRRWLGPLAQPRIRRIMVPLLVMGTVFGGTGIFVPAYAQHLDATGWIGPLLAATSIGGVIGGILYATLTLTSSHWHIYRILALAFALPACFLFLARPLWLLATLLMLAGLFVTPLFITAFLLVDATATDDTRIEANTWVGASADIANGAVAVTIGALVSAQRWDTALLLLSACAAAGVITALLTPIPAPGKGAQGTTGEHAPTGSDPVLPGPQPAPAGGRPGPVVGEPPATRP